MGLPRHLSGQTAKWWPAVAAKAGAMVAALAYDQAMPRHDFPARIKQELAIRAAFFCSNPRCLKLTAGPRSDGERGLATGHAAHICAASPGGPRYDPAQSEVVRRSAANGLWLCRECGDIVDKDIAGTDAETLRGWKRDHDAMITEVRMQGWSRTIELLRSNRIEPGLARRVIGLFEDRRVFWVAFDAEFPDRVRQSLDGLRSDLTRLRCECAAGSPLDIVIVALGQTIRHFFDRVERFDLVTLLCDSNDPEWSAFVSALRALRKSIGIQIAALAGSYDIPLQGEFAAHVARGTADAPNGPA